MVLLCVLESHGSSPGRQGFKMAVAADGEISGTIGGGIMEHKLVELSRTMLQNEDSDVVFKPQYHDKIQGKDRSGMICSGHQFVALVPLSRRHRNTIRQIVNLLDRMKNGLLEISPSGFHLSEVIELESVPKKLFQFESEQKWIYTESIRSAATIHIIGGGHVGLAVSQVMNLLSFFVKIYDDRSGLNTMEQNHFAHEKYLIDYENIGEQLKASTQDFVVVMTFGYRSDKIILKQLHNKKFAYLGLMGSAAKISELFRELENEGIAPENLKSIKAPVGIDIASKTAMEIAVSVAAEIIYEKNKHQPSQRNNTRNMKDTDQHFMKMAIALSEEGMNSNQGGPFGAIIVKNDEIIGRGNNRVTSTNDPTAHAEVTAIRDACKNVNDFQLSGSIMYTSCEPCPMCLAAIYWARIDRIVYGCTREDAAAIGFDDDFIYKEVCIPFDRRSIPIVQLGREEGLKVFKGWELKEDKIEF